MSTKYCIDKLLEKPYRPKSPEERIINVHENVISDCELEASGNHTANNYVVHYPREQRRPIYSTPYRPVHSYSHSRVAQCSCPTCNRDAPPWLKESRTPRFIAVDRMPPYQPYTRYPYVLKESRDKPSFVSSSLATRVKHQPFASTAGGSKRKKRHRTAFTPTQLLGLENAFEQNHYSVGEERKQLASFLGLSETQIKVWFQNRRTKWKRIRKEAEEMSTDDDEQGSESENFQHEATYSQFLLYSQHNTLSYNSQDEFYAREKLWPKGYVCGSDRYKCV